MKKHHLLEGMKERKEKRKVRRRASHRRHRGRR